MDILREAVFHVMKLGESSLIGTYFQNLLAVKNNIGALSCHKKNYLIISASPITTRPCVVIAPHLQLGGHL